MKTEDLILFISFLLIIAAMIIFSYYIFTEKVDECVSDPIKFGVEKIRQTYHVDKVYGKITIVKDYQTREWEFGDEPDFKIEI